MKLLSLLRAILREIFEESAYERFCARQACEPNRHSYQMFLRESEAVKSKKIACC